MRLLNRSRRRGMLASCIALVVRHTRGSSDSLHSTEYPYAGCSLLSIGNGCCDTENNNAECGYDGGDCCPCTCEEVTTCDGYVGFDCRDPGVECGRDPAGGGASASEYPACTGNVTRIGDGYCDDGVNNSPACGYDGGDCCPCTCDGAEGVEFSCTSVFSCRDPYADCASSMSSAQVSYLRLGCLAQRIGDGLCDSANNNEDCLFDGGDCCRCTCDDGVSGTCGTSSSAFDCQDPDADCDASSFWVPAMGSALGLVALGLGCRAIFRYGERRRAAAVGGTTASRSEVVESGSGSAAAVRVESDTSVAQ